MPKKYTAVINRTHDNHTIVRSVKADSTCHALCFLFDNENVTHKLLENRNEIDSNLMTTSNDTFSVTIFHQSIVDPVTQ